MPRLVPLLLSAALLCLAPAASPAQTAPPAPVVLTDGWAHKPDPQDAGRAAGWQARPAGEGWRDVRVPHLFDPNPTESGFFGTVGWYRATFTVPRAPEGFGWGLKFDSVRRQADVWLDGKALGRTTDPYVPTTLPAGRLAPGPHTLVLRVDNRKGKEPREGWWNWGGIVKPITLVPLGTLAADRPGLLPRRTCGDGGCRWTVLTDVELVNRSTRRIRPRVAVRLRARAGGPVSQKTVVGRPLAAGERARLRFDVPVRGDAKVWSPDDPQLYDGTVQLRDGSRVVQSTSLRVGLRTVDVTDGLLRLNGRPVELRGASIQEDAPGRGAALSDADVEWIVRELKAVGANVTRAHYLLDERLLRRFDEEGILVWSQAPIYHRDRLLETAAQRETALATVRGTVLSARTHPSVITHSVANELSVVPDEVPGTREFLEDARTLTRDLDPTLPASVDLLSYPGYARQATYAKFPLLGINSYFGWYPGKKNRPTGDVRLLGPYLRDMRTKYPQSALVVTEFGAESTMDGPRDVKETYAFQTDYVRTVLDVVERTPHIGGAIYWTLREFAVKPDWDGGAKREGVERDGIHNKALITYDGRRKPAWSVLQRNAATTPLWRDEGEVAAATGIRVPAREAGAGGTTLAVGVLAAFLALIAIDLWAFAGLRRAARLDREAAAREAGRRADGGQPRPARAAA